jgi:hypothetical protein
MLLLDPLPAGVIQEIALLADFSILRNRLGAQTEPKITSRLRGEGVARPRLVRDAAEEMKNVGLLTKPGISCVLCHSHRLYLRVRKVEVSQ